MTPETVTLKVGQKQALFAAAFDPSGNLIPTTRFTFASNNPTVAQAQSDGVVIGLKSGAAIVQVTAGQKSFNVAVSVESASAPVTSVETAPARTTQVPTGPPRPFSRSNPVPFTCCHRRIVGSSSRRSPTMAHRLNCRASPGNHSPPRR